MDAFGAAMRSCIANRGFHGLSADDAADKFVTLLEQHGFKYIASDFDATMISKHSGGYCDPESDADVLSSVTEHFKAVGERLKRSPINLVIVTFSDDTHVKDHPVYISGGRMVNKALELSACDAEIQKVYDFYPRFWEDPSRYKLLGLTAPMPKHKEYHLNQICADFGVELKEIILIDDDIYNCKNAKKIGAAALHVTRDGFKLTEVELL
ncbi:p36 protein [Babesia caballi]|uniref:P36 protein n=1 Tax=Babesia caballi TaxID=5871 RepID=A0AAV4LWA1_BABCB|nr:p36 protein [Babesia caballi]